MPATIDLELERDIAELQLAWWDLSMLPDLFQRAPEGTHDTPDVLLYSQLLVITYGRAFKRNSRGNIVGAPYLEGLNAEERRLHDYLIGLRDQYHAHSDPLPGRVTIHVQCYGDSGVIWSPSYTGAGMTRDEMRRLVLLAEKLRKVIEAAFGEPLRQIVEARLARGNVSQFDLGVDEAAPASP